MKINPAIKKFKQNAVKLYGDRLKQIILYGSYATGKETVDSDINLAVVLEDLIVQGKEIDRLIDIVTEINLEYSELISIYPVSAKNYEVVNSPLLMNIRKEGVAV